MTDSETKRAKELSDQVKNIGKRTTTRPISSYTPTPEREFITETPDSIVTKLNSRPNSVNIDVIKDFPKDIAKTVSDIKGITDNNVKRLNMSDLRWHGAGLTSVAHDTTLTGNGTAASPLVVVGGGGGLTPTSGQYKIFVTVGTTNADYLVSNYADIGAAINAAYSGLPSTGGTIYILDGAYSLSTTIHLDTLEKPCILMGSDAGAVTLNWTGGNNTAALIYNPTQAVRPGAGIQGLKFNGPSSAGSTVGVFMGGIGANDFKGAAGATIRDCYIQNFGTGLEIGNNCFLLTVDNCVINFNGCLIYENGAAGAGASIGTPGTNTINAGENMRVINCTLADSNQQQAGQSTARYAINLQNSGVTDWNFVTTSFDDAELYINKSGGTANQVHLIGSHFENPAGDSILKYSFITMLSAQAASILDLEDTVFVQDASTTGLPDQFINAGSQVSMLGCSFVNNNAATVTRIVNFQNADGTNSLRWYGCTYLNSPATYIANSLPVTGAGLTDGGTGYIRMSATGTLIAQNTNTILDASTFAGADIGAQINAAYAYINTLGFKSGIITVPAGSFSFSTPIVFGTNGVRVSLRGTPGGGTILTYTGAASTIAITVNTGIQSGSPVINHTSYEAIRDITLVGPSSSSTNPVIGIYMGGANGAAGAEIYNVDISTFGQGVYWGANTYHTNWYGGVIRHCAQLMYFAASNNSGEALHFYDGFFVDPFDATYSTSNAIQMDNSSVSSGLFSGCSFDDMSFRIMQANDVTFEGCHWENPASSNWGAYTYLQIDQNPATTVTITGNTFYATGSTSLTNYISSGGTVTITGCAVRKFAGSTLTNFAVITGSGVLQWTNLNSVSSPFTNVVAGIPATNNGWTSSAGTNSQITKAGIVKMGVAIVTTNSTYAILPTDEIIVCSSPFTATLPTSVGLSGKRYTVKNTSGSVVVLGTTSAQTIDGLVSVSVSPYVTVVSDNTNWLVIT